MRDIQILDRPIAFHRAFVTICGSINAALFFSQCVYWTNRTKDKDGWFYKTRDEWEEETGLTRYEQEGARKNLKALGLIEEDLRGVPATLYYKINEERLSAYLNGGITVGGKPSTQLGENHPTGKGKTTQLSQRLRRDYAETTSIVDSSVIDARASYQTSENETPDEDAPQEIGLRAPAYPDTKTTAPKTKPATAKDLKDFDKDFASKVWLSYPKKASGRAAALAACAKLSIDAWAMLLTTIESWNSHWKEMEAQGDLQYVPGLAKWVKDGRYEALPVIRASGRSTGQPGASAGSSGFRPTSTRAHVEDPTYPYRETQSAADIAYEESVQKRNDHYWQKALALAERNLKKKEAEGGD